MRTVCFCNTNIPWGGGEKWHLEAAAALAARGWRVLFLCHPQGELMARAQGVPGLDPRPLALGRLSFLNPLLRLRLTRLFKEERVHALLMNLPSDLKAAGPAAKTAGVPHIVYRRGSALPVRDTALNHHLYGTVLTRLIVNSEATKRMALSRNPDLIPEERISVLLNGIDVAAFDAALARVPAREPEPGRPLVLGNAGRLNVQKGQHLLLHLCRKALDLGTDCRAVIAGTGEREAELKALADTLGIRNKVEFRGFMPDLSPFWRDIDVFVLTSLWEGFGYVLLEAMLAEKPVFAFSVSNIPELVRDGDNGRLFPLPEAERKLCPDAAPAGSSTTNAAQDPLDAMARSLAALAANPGEQRRMGRVGRVFAQNFDQSVRMDALENLLH